MTSSHLVDEEHPHAVVVEGPRYVKQPAEVRPVALPSLLDKQYRRLDLPQAHFLHNSRRAGVSESCQCCFFFCRCCFVAQGTRSLGGSMGWRVTIWACRSWDLLFLAALPVAALAASWDPELKQKDVSIIRMAQGGRGVGGWGGEAHQGQGDQHDADDWEVDAVMDPADGVASNRDA